MILGDLELSCNNSWPSDGRQQAFGLSFVSGREFAELNRVSIGSALPATDLRWGDTPPTLPLPHTSRGLWQARPGEFLLTVPRVARYYVVPDGITVSPEPEASDETVRLFLFGSAIGALLHLNGILALHGSAVRLPDGKGAALFTGVSTAGKSTLAAALAQRGYPPLADDIAAVHFDATGRAWLYPGLARCKLWGNALDKLNLCADAGERLRPDLDKYSIELATWAEPEPLAHVYELLPREQGEVTLAPIKGLEKLRLLDRQTYRPAFVDGLGLRSDHLRRLGQLATQASMGQIIRPYSQASTLDAIIARLIQDWA